MMNFTDIFIKRPVLASVLSLLIFIVGFASIFKMTLRQYPQIDRTQIVVTTSYPGASNDVIQSFITTPLAKSIGSANGIDYIESSSSLGLSQITVMLKLEANPDTALTEITGKVSASRSQLPRDAYEPSIQKNSGNTLPDIILSFTSTHLSPEQMTAFIRNIITPMVFSAGDIGDLYIWGAKDYSMRIWINPEKMAQLGMTTKELTGALVKNNVLATPGQLKGHFQYIDLVLSTDLHQESDFNQLVIRNDHGHIIRVQDIGKAELTSLNDNYRVLVNGQDAVFLGISSAPDANPLTVIAKVKEKMHEIERSLPAGLEMSTVYDSTLYISEAIHDVIKTIFEAIVIVLIVIFLFLGSLRSCLIPIVTIPLSLVGVCSFMLWLGFSINLMTLLAMVLAIGLVVDDAIVVLENIYRHIEEGMDVYDAAIKGAREIVGPIVVMTLTLAAVFAPIGFLGGITGSLFTEFAFTLAASVIISGVIALTLSPMLCARWINASVSSNTFVRWLDQRFADLKNRYEGALGVTLKNRGSILFLMGSTVFCCVIFTKLIPQQLAPFEDKGFVGTIGVAPSSANLAYLEQAETELTKIFDHYDTARKNYFMLLGVMAPNQIFGGLILKPWSERSITPSQIKAELQGLFSQVPSLKLFAYEPSPLPGVDKGFDVELVLKSTQNHAAIQEALKVLKEKAQKSGLFAYIDTSLHFDRPRLVVNLDREKSASLGISMDTISSTFSTMTGDGLVNYFSRDGYNFAVTPQVMKEYRNNQNNLDRYYIPTASGKLVPLSAIATYETESHMTSLPQFQQLNAGKFTAILIPGTAQGKALEFLKTIVENELSKEMMVDYSGQSRQFVQEGHAMVYAFILAILIIFLVLAAQFESYRDPIIILAAVPLSSFGALLPLFLGFATLNIYTEIALVTLIGLITKHGILIVEFANKQQAEHRISRVEAVIHASTMRLRPILMTTAAMVCGVLPMIVASGAGAVSRFHLGLTIACGMIIGTCFTLFVVPVIYSYIAKTHHVSTNKN